MRRGIGLPGAFWRALEARAEAEGTTLAALVRRAVAEMLGQS